MKIYIIRHGETALNSKGLLQGRIDEPLNKSGRDLAKITGSALKGVRFDRCVSSPLYRAKETAEIILRESGNDIPVQTDDRLLEISFGNLEGKTLEELGEESTVFYTDPFQFSGFPEGESIRDVCRRTQAFLKELVASDDGKTYLISTHGTAMRGMINYLLEDPSDYWLSHVPYNCSFTIVEAEGGKARVTDIDKVYYGSDLIVDYYRKQKTAQ